MVGVGADPATSHNAEPGTDAVEAEVRRIVAQVRALVVPANRLPAGVRARLAQVVQREFAAVETSALAELKQQGASDRDIERRAAAGGTRSRKESSKRKERAAAVGHNPVLAHKLGRGELGEEHVDALADASAKSAGEAACDAGLIKELEHSRPDDAHKVTTQWLERREDDGAQSRHDRQRSRRKAKKGRSFSSGCSTIELHGTDETNTEMWARIQQRSHELYLADGGRDVPDDQHPRTHQQRMFDAAYELITQEPSAGTLSTSEDHKAEPMPGSVRAPQPRSMIHVTLCVDDDAEAQIRAQCPNGQGYLPDSVFERYRCGAMLGGTVFNQRGEILWFGRKRRYATPAQFAALVVRDGGCVMCGADVNRCQAHHLDPFNAPVQGETNIDELALVCTSCHHWLHDDNHTLHFELPRPNPRMARGSPPKRIWRTRPATPQEIAPKRRPETQPPPDKPRVQTNDPRNKPAQTSPARE